MNSNFTGIVLALAGGVLVGNCMLPLKKIRTWPWECTWLVFSLVSLVFVPCLIAALAVPAWPGIYASLPFSALLPSLLFGFGWGIAQVLFGISVVRLGMALAFTIIVGLGTVFGTLVPLFVLHKGDLANGNAEMLVAGCGLMIFGVALSGYAGKLREHPQRATEHDYRSGLGIAILSGVLSSMLNLSLAFGSPISQMAVRNGASTSTAVFAVWPVALAGGLVPNLAYAVYLLCKNKSWGKLMHTVQDAFLSLLMGLLWIGAVAIYGLSTRYLGRLGDSAGWAIYQIAMILTATTGGIVVGEWKVASRRSLAVLASGVFILILATVATAVSTR
ncbi:L-rhamnose/proton symporter RhaT [Alloacidobacterium sp.]|uniref:L-rhamnose/proton symporter RhaT n=1 Tax=Alloacidobacterium sp. TaxID=2951999 RepID=UPI002D57A851|nr:L-rhamnose/proton symporter RhaT [Alloacidobacterium sp.]HYK37821.1 L-rhamnose/proton symporter RhaT [Alloacidobacterium sp.]